MKLHCDYDITLFPFDNQTCVIVLGPWEHNASEIYITLPRKRGGVLNVSAAEPRMVRNHSTLSIPQLIADK